MGNLLRILLSNDPPSKCGDIFVDFENATPTEAEQDTWNCVDNVLKSLHGILDELQTFESASNEIRLAISHPKDESLQKSAWGVVCPLVGKLKRFYEFSLKLGEVTNQLLSVLCSADKTSRQHLECQQALFKQFAEMLDFVLHFDELKMANPAVQNVFSYYRRSVNRIQMSKEGALHCVEVELGNEIANKMSMFYAEATPMLKFVSDVTATFVSQHKELPVEQTTDCLSTMADICRVMIENPEYNSRFVNEEARFFCLRVMVGVIILYDHVHPVGAFSKTSGIEIKSYVKVLNDQDPSRVEGLLNALRYTTRHLNDEATPRSTRALLA